MTPSDHSQPSEPHTDPAADDPGSLFCPEVAELVAIAAAVGSHCEPCLRHHVREAERLGVSRADIDRAVALAAQVKVTPHRNILALAARLTGSPPEGGACAGGGGSCCA
jgi:AhpD family alkylhydroperoxidase